MRTRTAVLVCCWVLAVVAATAVGWGGVRLVANEVSPADSSALSQAEVERRIHAASPGISPSSASPSPSSPAPASQPPSGSASPGSTSPATVQRSVSARGGTVVLLCTGAVLATRSSPRPGFAVSDDAGAHVSTVTVVFSDGEHRSQVQGGCDGGVPAFAVVETGSTGDE